MEKSKFHEGDAQVQTARYISSHGDVKYSAGDIVRDTMWAPDLPEAHLVRYRNA